MLDTPFGISFIVTASYDSKALERCVKSIQAQLYDNIQIIIVKDISTYVCSHIIENLCRDDCRQRTICITNVKNHGRPAARNTGFNVATKSHIWYVDANDYLPSVNVAGQIMQVIKNHGIAAIKFPVFTETNENPFISKRYLESFCGKIKCDISRSYEITNQFEKDELYLYVFEKKFIETLGIKSLENVNINEDQILLCQLLKKIPCIGLINIPMYVKNKIKTAPILRWVITEYLQERIFFYFTSQLMRDTPAMLPRIFKNRCNIVEKKLQWRAKADLGKDDYNLIINCWKSDYERFKKVFCCGDDYTKESKITSFFVNINEQYLSDAFDKIFSNAEIVIHCGAHKTASTYIQGKLNDFKYDLALEGIVYIDYLEFRNTFLADGKIAHMTDDEIKRNLVKLLLPLLFRMPKRIIISDENLIGHGKPNHKFKSYFACHKNGFDTKKLERLISLLVCCRISIYYCIRNYVEYITSNYCEKIKWRVFDSFDSYTSDLFSDIKNISWIYIIEKLERMRALNPDLKVHTLKYEDYMCNPLHVASLLAGKEIFSSNTQQELFGVENLLRRPSPSQETLDVSMNAINAIGRESAQKLYKYLTSFCYGDTKYMLQYNQMIYSELNSNYSDLHEVCSLTRLENISDIESIDPLNTDFKELTKPISKTSEAFMRFLDNKPEDIDFLANSNAPALSNKFHLNNKERVERYNIYFQNPRNQRRGFSAMLRVRNEETNIRKVVQNCLLLFDEVVVIDNYSSDRTLEIIESLKDTLPSEQIDRIKIYTYPFHLSKCGFENFKCDENSFHSLAYFYNYALSKCSYTYICKWDGDMIMTETMISRFLNFKQKFIQKSLNMEDVQCSVHGRPKGLTVYRGFNGRFYYQANHYEHEVRLFPNNFANIFVKDIMWERLFTALPVQIINSKDPVFIEYKDVAKNEFSHWEDGRLAMGIRKRNELKYFNLVAKLTKNGSPSVDDLIRLKLKEVNSLADIDNIG